MRYVIVFGWLLLSLSATASPINGLARLLEPYRAFSADFQQSTLDAKGSSITEMTGALAIASESIFYWKTNPPFSQVIVADGEVLWVFDEDLNQVQVRPFDDTLAASPAAIFSGDLDVLGARFQVTEERSASIAIYTLEPRATDEVTRQIVLRFDGTRLLDLSIEDALGNRSLVSLTEVKHGKLADALFQFTPPVGADVIYALGDQ
ncbi:MAG: outer membrane lipoprotein chaperone LolA [Pseudomonadota bacterium]|nr:outer membrane lipoprotein chaperone LolA [Pseudomonadota bacterium]MEE2820891.1 outer membrane lipoprotein chaperone LolA [Pseudomonadota bacterium]